MALSLDNFFKKGIEYLFYAFFLFVPLIFWGDTSELFEFNKLWFTFILTIIIVLFWIGRSIVNRSIIFRRSFLDIPILLFLLSQVISTIFSIDQHISVWGYYTRFNGGLLSLVSYILLYFAFMANLGKNHAINILKVSITSAFITALWGLPSHYSH